MSPAEPPEPAGLYLHVPFCATVCPYCDFAVRADQRARRERFVASLVTEIELAGPDWQLAFDTVHFGGGTPSLLEPRQLARILEAVRSGFALAADTRVTLEANPEDVGAERARAWRALGAGTLSLGVQSFDPRALEFLGRRHTPEGARSAFAAARAAGFDTVSLDLIYGHPLDSVDRWRADLEAAMALAPDHISCYQLTVSEGTLLGKRRRRGELHELEEDRQAELFLLTHEFLGERGLHGYEVSNFARSPAHRSRHNRKYWRHVPYLGLGPSAHSFDGRRRWWNERRLDAWEARLARGERPVAGEETLAPRDLAVEELMLGLRTDEGVDIQGFATRHGNDLIAANRDAVARLEREGLLEIARGRLRPTRRGLVVADAIARAFAVLPGDTPPSPPRS